MTELTINWSKESQDTVLGFHRPDVSDRWVHLASDQVREIVDLLRSSDHACLEQLGTDKSLRVARMGDQVVFYAMSRDPHPSLGVFLDEEDLPERIKRLEYVFGPHGEKKKSPMTTTAIFGPAEEPNPRAKWLGSAQDFGIHLRNAQIETTQLNGADLRNLAANGAQLRDAHIEGIQADRLQAWDADFSDANFRDSRFDGAQWGSVNAMGSIATGANLENVTLEGANLKGAKMKGTNFKGANLSGQDLEGLDCTDVNLRGLVLHAIENPPWQKRPTREPSPGEGEGAWISARCPDEKDWFRNFDSLILWLRARMKGTPSHYTGDEPLAMFREQGCLRDFARGSAIKYLARFDKSGHAEDDLMKAAHYVFMLIKLRAEGGDL